MCSAFQKCKFFFRDAYTFLAKTEKLLLFSIFIKKDFNNDTTYIYKCRDIYSFPSCRKYTISTLCLFYFSLIIILSFYLKQRYIFKNVLLRKNKLKHNIGKYIISDFPLLCTLCTDLPCLLA